MYCPNCGQQQVSDEMRFCSRCGLALSGVAEWLAGGRPPARREDAQSFAALSPRRKAIRRAAKAMFFSGALFPVFLAISIAVDEPGPLVLPFLLFFASTVVMLYAWLFMDKTVVPAPANYQSPQTTALGSTPARGSLPPARDIPMPGRRHVRTNELAQPPSVTENTTKFFDNE